VTDPVEKYDGIARDFSEHEYADPELYARRRAEIVLGLGPRLAPAATLLDHGCGDGIKAPPFVAAGLDYAGVDASSSMVAEARASHPGLSFEVGTIDEFEPREPVDCTICLRAFYYAADRQAFFAKVRAYTHTKFVLDCRPEVDDVGAIADDLRAAGFGRVDLRPFFLPQSRSVPSPLLPAVSALERTGPLARLLLRRHGRLFCAASG